MSDLRGSSARATALAVLGALLVGGLVLDATDDGGGPARREVVAGIAMPAARAEPSLASTWYCAAGTASADGFGDHVVIIANPTERARSATITAVPGTIAAGPAIVEGDEEATTTSRPSSTTTSTTAAPEEPADLPTTEVDVPARSRVTYRIGDLVQAPLAGAVVEVDGGEVAVEHELTGSLGRTTSPCSTTVSASWSFPWGVTTRGNRELLVFMNPFPDDATVDVAFATDEGPRESSYFNGFVVPGRSVVGAYVDSVITRREQVSAQVTVRGGRLVVERVQTFSGVDGREGITTALGAPVAAAGWMFPDGYTGPGLAEQIIVYNPGDRVAEVEVEARLDDPDTNGVPEPFELTVPPGRYALVNLHEDDRMPEAVGHSIVVRSLNGVPVVAERAIAATEGSTRRGVSVTPGSPLAAPTWYLPGGGTSAERDEYVTVLNASDDEAVTFSVTSPTGGQVIPLLDLQDVVLEPGARLAIRISDKVTREDLPLVVAADGPIVVERGLFRVGGDGLSQAICIPLAVDTVEPDPL